MLRTATSFLLAAFVGLLPHRIVAQAPVSSTIAPPLVGLILRYQFWPEQYVQWIDRDLPYSMLELDVDAEGKTPVYNVTLTERTTLKRVQYTNSDAVLAVAKEEGYEAHKTQIAFEPAGSAKVGATSNLRLLLADGKALQWRFVQGSELSDRGSGLTPLRQAPMPVFAFREQGAVAADGTVLQIGSVVSAASAWDAYSSPPYFIAYHGAYTTRAHRLTFAVGKEIWTTTSSPSALATGATWQMDNGEGVHRTLTIDRIQGDHYTISGRDQIEPSIHFVLEATRTADVWSIEQIRYIAGKGGEKKPLELRFTPSLTPATTTNGFNLVFGKNTVLASGGLTTSGPPTDFAVVLQMKSPPWVHDKSIAVQSKVDGQTLTTVAKVSP